MSLTNHPSIEEYKRFLRDVTGLHAVAWFPKMETGKIEFVASGCPEEAPQMVKLKLATRSTLLKIESHLVATEIGISENPFRKTMEGGRG